MQHRHTNCQDLLSPSVYVATQSIVRSLSTLSGQCLHPMWDGLGSANAVVITFSSVVLAQHSELLALQCYGLHEVPVLTTT